MRRVALMALACWAGAVFLVCAPTLAWGAPGKVAKATDFKSVLSGKVIPLSLKLKDLNNAWRRFMLVEMGGMAGVFGPVTTVGGAYYSKGETVTVAGESFLVCYRQQTAQISFLQMMGGPEGVEVQELTAESPIRLSLLNVRNLPGLNDIRPFNLEQELAEYKQAQEAAAESMAEMGAGELDNLKQLAIAVQMYVVDCDGALPPLDDPEVAAAALMEYVSEESVFTDPDTEEPYSVNSGLSGKHESEFEDPAQVVVFYQAEPGEDGRRGVAFLDGHASRVTESEWEKLKASSGMGE